MRTFIPVDGDSSDTCTCGAQFSSHAESDIQGTLECPISQHKAGEHWDGPVMDCVPCVEEWVALGGKDEMGILKA